jgi:hypothetical protein
MGGAPSVTIQTGPSVGRNADGSIQTAKLSDIGPLGKLQEKWPKFPQEERTKGGKEERSKSTFCIFVDSDRDSRDKNPIEIENMPDSPHFSEIGEADKQPERC